MGRICEKITRKIKIPVLIHGDFEPMEDADTIAAYLEDTFSEPNLSSNATDAGRDLYSKFALFMRNGNISSKGITYAGKFLAETPAYNLQEINN